MTIYKTLLSRGYFPKELPPSFFTDYFAAYATSKNGRQQLKSYNPEDNFTECVAYRLALPGLSDRQLRIPHPHTFSQLAYLTAQNFRRLLKKASISPFAKSRPVYEDRQRRAIRTSFKPGNLAKERANTRGGASFLLKVDISQYYPSLYTHAIGWAINPKLRESKYRKKNHHLLGKQIDQCLMNLQGKISQGIPIGNDISFLLAEIVLAQIDKALKIKPRKGYRWYDDYEIACDTRGEAEEVLANLQKNLDMFNLRINPKKTQILELPQMASDNWHEVLIDASESASKTSRAMVWYFDTAIGLSVQYPEYPVMLYAIGILFRYTHLSDQILRVAESCITQAMLSEPGSAQKGFSLLKYWNINGCSLDNSLLIHTIDQIVLRHQWRGASNDVAWALAFCIEQGLHLSSKTGRALASLEDDVIAIQTLHANSLNLINGFSERRIEHFLQGATPDGKHWLALYESVRHNFLPRLQPIVASNKLLQDLLNKEVTFYRPKLRPYSLVLHSGGVPDWIAKNWIKKIKEESPEQLENLFKDNAFLAIIGEDIREVPHEEKNEVEIILELISLSEPQIQQFESYV